MKSKRPWSKKLISDIYEGGFTPHEVCYLINKKQRGVAKIIGERFFLTQEDADKYLKTELPKELRGITEIRWGLFMEADYV